MAATVTPLSNGPLMVKGEVEVVDAQGNGYPHRAMPSISAVAGLPGPSRSATEATRRSASKAR